VPLMYQNPDLVQALARDHLAELRRAAQRSGRGRHGNRRRSIFLASRQATGWLLVDLGLRLAVPRGVVVHALAHGRAMDRPGS
jgi:hypothetical protein